MRCIHPTSGSPAASWRTLARSLNIRVPLPAASTMALIVMVSSADQPWWSAFVAGGTGLEPVLTGPKPVVLPVTPPPIGAVPIVGAPPPSPLVIVGDGLPTNPAGATLSAARAGGDVVERRQGLAPSTKKANSEGPLPESATGRPHRASSSGPPLVDGWRQRGRRRVEVVAHRLEGPQPRRDGCLRQDRAGRATEVVPCSEHRRGARLSGTPPSPAHSRRRPGPATGCRPGR